MEGYRLDGQIAVVTGARGNLGPVWCGALLDAGATVIALDLAGAPVSHGFRDVAKVAGSRLVQVEGDVTDRASIERVASECEASVGAPCILINNAGIDQPPAVMATQRLTDISAAAFSTVMTVNVLGAFVAMQVFGESMVARGSGSIVNIGSLYASVSPDAHFYDHLLTDPPFLKPPAYGASKAALVNLTRYFATHWGPAGVRVNALSPGGVAGGQDPLFVEKFTSRVPLGRMAGGEELRGPLLFLASEASSYVTGIELIVDGGFTAW